jgi:NAD+ synthetase
MKEQIKQIRNNIKQYIIENKIKSVVIGISGGLDSAVNTALLYPVCQELGINLIGRYIHIESNQECEKFTANKIGMAFCDNFKCIDLTEQFNNFPVEGNYNKIRRGNIKARMRMMYLRDLTHYCSGIMIDNSNKTEYNLGFFTIADGGDYSPLMNYWKTEVYEIAKLLEKEYSEDKALALKYAINMIPTDGLGISSSDLEQIGAESYEQVDNILQEILAWKWLSLEKRGDKYDSIKEMRDAFLEEQAMYCYPIEVIIAVTDRYFNSEFKRKQLPIKITRDEI